MSYLNIEDHICASSTFVEVITLDVGVFKHVHGNVNPLENITLLF